MEFYRQLILDGLARGALTVTLDPETRRWMEDRCMQTLGRIRAILEDEELDDETCFLRIEGIMDAFEQMGYTVANRHDFG